MTRIIALSLSKGGVGKTTTAVNLAAGLATSGRRVLLVDTDTQGQADKMLGVKTNRDLSDLLEGQYHPRSGATYGALYEARQGLYLIPGGPRLAGIKRQIAMMEMRSEEVLARAMKGVGGYDYIILDTAPGWDVLQVNVLFYAGEILAPVALETMAVSGLIEFHARVKKIQQYRDVNMRYILPTFLDRRTKQSGEILRQIEEHFGDTVLEPIRYNVRLSEAPAHGQTIFEYAPNSAGAIDYMELTRRIMNDE